MTRPRREWGAQDIAELGLADLVWNRTMSPEVAATLAAAAGERLALLVFARPRLAGKTTTMLAALDHAPEGTPVHELSTEKPGLGIPDPPDGGYLVMHEIAQAPMPHYLWGEPVRRVFEALRGGGFSLATVLHADGIEEAFSIIIEQNEVPVADAALLDYAVHIRSLGPDWREPTRRVVAGLYEVTGAGDGAVAASPLHRWDEGGDRFEVVGEPSLLAHRAGLLARLTEDFRRRRPE